MAAVVLVLTAGAGSAFGAPSTSILTWTGAGLLWSGRDSWSPALAPSAGDSLVFPATATGKTSMNDLAPGALFGSLQIDGSGYTFLGNSIQLGGGINATFAYATQEYPLDVALTASQTVAVGSSSATLTLSGTVSGAASLTKTGDGTLALTGTPSLTGTLTISGGMLRVDGTTTAPVAVMSGGTLGGTGTVSMVRVAAGGVCSPGGSSTGILTVASIGMSSGSTVSIQADGATAGTGYDQLRSEGSVALNGATLSLSGSIAAGRSVLKIIDVTDATPVSGTFTGLPEGSIVTVNGVDFTISYVGGDGNDVTLTSGPAPTTLEVAAGDDQSTAVGTVFATALKVRVLDEASDPCPGAEVTFTAPASGASGDFASSSTVTTDADGYATAPAFTANTLAGSYEVTASCAGVALPVSFSLTNTIAPRIMSADAAAFVEGIPGTFTVTATGTPVATLAATGALPAGVTFVDNGDGTAMLGGAPAPGTAADYRLTITAANGTSPDATQAFTLRVSASAAPVTTVSGVPSGWSRRAVSLAFHAAPGQGGPPVAYTEYRVGRGAWHRGDRVTVRSQGVTRVTYRSVDTAGGIETARACTVRIDSVRPVVAGYGHPVSWQGGVARFHFRVTDRAAGSVRARLVITRYGQPARVFRLGRVATGKRLVAVVRCGLPVGTWNWRIDVRDPAGNRGVGSRHELEVYPR